MARIDREIGETLNMTARFSGGFIFIATFSWLVDLLVQNSNATDVDQRPFFQRPAGKTTEAFLIIALITLIIGATRCIYLDRQRSNNRDNDYLAISSDDESATSSDNDSETSYQSEQNQYETESVETAIHIPNNNFRFYDTSANSIEINQRSNTPSDNYTLNNRTYTC